MKSLYTLLTTHADVLAGLIVGLLYAGLLASWLSYEDAALAAERRYRELERLLVIVIAAEAERDKRGDGGASSRLAADRAADCGCRGTGDVPQGANRPDNGDGRTGRQAHPGDATRLIVE